MAFERLKLVNNNKFISKFLNFFLIYNSNYFLNVKKFDILQLSRYLISNRSILINKLNLRNNRNFYKSWRKKYLFWRSLILNSNSLNKNIKISKILLKNWAFFYNQEIRKFNNSFINFEDNKNTKSFILKHININLFKDSIFLYENKYNTINNALIYPFFIDFKDNKNLKLKHFIEGGVLKRKKYGISSQKKQFRRAIHLLRKMFKNKSLLAFKNKRILNKKFSLKNVMFQNFIWKPSYVELDYNTFRFIISDTNILSSPNFYNLSFKNYKFLLLYMSKRGY